MMKFVSQAAWDDSSDFRYVLKKKKKKQQINAPQNPNQTRILRQQNQKELF